MGKTLQLLGYVPSFTLWANKQPLLLFDLGGEMVVHHLAPSSVALMLLLSAMSPPCSSHSRTSVATLVHKIRALLALGMPSGQSLRCSNLSCTIKPWEISTAETPNSLVIFWIWGISFRSKCALCGRMKSRNDPEPCGSVLS